MVIVCYYDDYLVVNVYKGLNFFMYKFLLYVYGNLVEKNFFDVLINN